MTYGTEIKNHQELLDQVEQRYGYRPDESHEDWTLFNDSLIVADGNGAPRLYRPGCRGTHVEIKAI